MCGSLSEASAREWLVTDGRGGYAMGTVSGLRTRRYHGLLMVSAGTVGVRRLGLAALDPVLVIGGRRIHLAVHEWAGGTVMGARVAVPATALAQAVRRPERQVRLARLVRQPTTDVTDLDRVDAANAGRVTGASSHQILATMVRKRARAH